MELKPCPFRVHGERTASLTISGEFYYNEIFMPCLREECPAFISGNNICTLYGANYDLNRRANQIGRPLEKRGFSKCFICGHKFDRAEDAYIAHVKNHKNVFLCEDCADLVQAEEGET